MSRIEDQVCEKIQKRAEFGLKKYGVTLEREDLTLDQWIVHLQEELMDATLYLERVQEKLAERKYEVNQNLLVRSASYDGEKIENRKNPESF